MGIPISPSTIYGPLHFDSKLRRNDLELSKEDKNSIL